MTFPTDDNVVIAASGNFLILMKGPRPHRFPDLFDRTDNKIHKFHAWGVCVQV